MSLWLLEEPEAMELPLIFRLNRDIFLCVDSPERGKNLNLHRLDLMCYGSHNGGLQGKNTGCDRTQFIMDVLRGRCC